MKKLVKFLDALTKTKTPDDVFSEFIQFTNGLDLPFATYFYSPDIFLEASQISFLSNLTGNCTESSLDRDVLQYDFGYWHCLYKNTPLKTGWAFQEEFKTYPNQYINLLRTAFDEVGWHTGLCIPLRTPRLSARAGIHVGSRMDRDEFIAFLDLQGTTLLSAAYTTHTRYQMLLMRKDQKGIDLSQRHKEYLSLLANGQDKPNELMNISRQRTDQLRAECCHKLGVKTRIQAVARAIELGLISSSPKSSISGFECQVDTFNLNDSAFKDYF